MDNFILITNNIINKFNKYLLKYESISNICKKLNYSPIQLYYKNYSFYNILTNKFNNIKYNLNINYNIFKFIDKFYNLLNELIYNTNNILIRKYLIILLDTNYNKLLYCYCNYNKYYYENNKYDKKLIQLKDKLIYELCNKINEMCMIYKILIIFIETNFYKNDDYINELNDILNNLKIIEKYNINDYNYFNNKFNDIINNFLNKNVNNIKLEIINNNILKQLKFINIIMKSYINNIKLLN